MWNNQKQQKTVFPYVKLTNLLSFQTRFPKTGPTYRGKWLIHGPKCRKDNQLQSLEPPVEYPNRECKHDIKESKGNMFNPTFKENVQEQKHPGSCAFAKPELLM